MGLCWVDPKSQIPKSWGFKAEDLPPLGASPDGLIRHNTGAQSPPSAAAALPVHSGSLGQSTVPAKVRQQSPEQSSPARVGNVAAQTASAGVVTSSSGSMPQLQSRNAQQPQSATQQPVAHTMQAKDSSLSDFEVLLAKLEVSSKKLINTSAQCNSFSRLATQSYPPRAAAVAQSHVSSDAAAPSSSASAVPLAPIPQPQRFASSASSVIATTAGTHGSISFSHGTPPQVVVQEQPQSLVNTATSGSLSAAPAASRDIHGANEASQATSSAEEGCTGGWLEAVEIKNVCPFREVRDMTGNGKSRRLFRLSDPGPYSRVQAYPLPSLLHCEQLYTV